MKTYKELELKSWEGTTNYTKVLQEEEFQFNAPHTFRVVGTKDKKLISQIHFQEGPMKESQLNGLFMEDLLVMCLARLESFQNSDFACEENDRAIKGIVDALQAMKDRTSRRTSEGTLGTMKK